jgi:hypothetical protein
MRHVQWFRAVTSRGGGGAKATSFLKNYGANPGYRALAGLPTSLSAQAPTQLEGYPDSDSTGARLRDFNGNLVPGVGALRVTHREKLPLSNPYASYRYSYEVEAYGHRYSGRGYGASMALLLKRRKA